MPSTVVVALIAGGASVLAALIALAGVLGGVFMEPLKHRFAATAGVRQERAERCAKLIESARDARDGIADLAYLIDRGQRRGTDWRTARARDIQERMWLAAAALRPTAALLALSGPDELATEALRLATAVHGMIQPREGMTKRENYENALTSIDATLDSFVTVARKHVR